MKRLFKKFWKPQQIAKPEKRKESIFEPLKVEMPQQETEPGLNTDSPTWKYVVGYAATEIQRLREANDKPHGVEKTQEIRGNIKALKKLIALPEKEVRDNRTVTNRQGILADGMKHHV